MYHLIFEYDSNNYIIMGTNEECKKRLSKWKRNWRIVKETETSYGKDLILREKQAEKWEIRQLDCYLYDDEWTQNTSYRMGDMITKSDNIGKALALYLKNKHGITFKKNRTRIIYDFDCFTIEDRKTHEPLFVAIPCY